MAIIRTTGLPARGFSMIELLLVVSILLILAAIGVYNLEGAQGRAKASRAKADMRALAVGIESYAVDHNDYPPNLPVARAGVDASAPAWHLPVTPPQITTPVGYLSSLPADPFRIGRNTYGLALADELPEERLFYNYFRIIEPAGWMQDHLDGRHTSLIAVNVAEEDPVVPGNRGARRKYGDWVVWSCGPDLRNWEAGQDYLVPGDLGSPLGRPSTPPIGYTFDIPYDPTNGSTSFGNIFGTQAGIMWRPDTTSGPRETKREAPGDTASNPRTTGGNNGPPGEEEGDAQERAQGSANGTEATKARTGGGVRLAGGTDRAEDGNRGPGSEQTRPSSANPADDTAASPAESPSSKRVIAMTQILHARVQEMNIRAPRPPKPPAQYDGRFASLGLLMLALLFMIAYITFKLLRKAGGTDENDPDAMSDETIAGFDNLAAMTTLHLANTHITDEGLRHLDRAASLESLNLWGAHITDEGLAAISHLPKLRELVLTDTRITDEGVRHLTGLQGLRELVLMGTDISDKSVPELAKLTGLTQLNLRETQVTPEGLLRLRKALPHCEIKYAALSEELAPGD